MVRSKFPGKPSKIVNRKVVKSKKYCALHDNESSKAAENISYGLAVFNETFGDHEQVSTAFHGFSPHEVEEAEAIAFNQQLKVEQEYSSNGLNFSPDDACPVKIDLPTPQLLSLVKSNLSLIGPVGFHSTRAQRLSLQLKNVGAGVSKSFSPSKLFSPRQSNFKKHVANRILQKAKKTTFESSPCGRLTNSQFDKNGALNRKFVLPSRSMRSSRVIKPNKRFLESEEKEKEKEKDLLLTDNQAQPSHTRVIELKKPRLILDANNEVLALRSVGDKVNSTDAIFVLTSPSCSGVNGNKEHVKLGELNVFGAPTTRPKRRISQSTSCDGSPKKEPSSASSPPSKVGPTSDPPSPSRSKLILRESKLNISPTRDKQNEKLLSKKTKKSLNIKVLKSPGTSIECSVCGAVRFHRLTKQSFKFGLICCDPCRKFITKMMLRSRSAESSVPCEIGQGNCAVSSPYKGESFATKVNRCSACWLLLCVQRLVNMPEKVRDSLIRMLPANMQGMTVVLLPMTNVSHVSNARNRRRKGQSIRESEGETSSSPTQNMKSKPACGQSTPNSAKKLSTSSSSKRVPQTPIARIKRKAALVSLANNLRRVREKTFNSVNPQTSLKINLPSGDAITKQSKIKKVNLSRKSVHSTKCPEKPIRGASKNLEKNKDGQVRQKLSLKGPRVKHVCRSASIVLGQPLATFPMKSPNSATLESDGTDVLAVNPEVHVQRNDDDLCGNILNEQYKVPTVADGRKQKYAVTKPLSEPVAALSFAPGQSTKILPKSFPDLPASILPGRKITKHPYIPNQNKIIKKGQRRTLQDLGVCNTPSNIPLELVSLDFWESYDPDEVCNSGFSLLGFGPLVSKPICFLCGSAGKKKLIHCASCCEPYHKFCVEMGVGGWVGPAATQSNAEEWRIDWVCPRCTVCHGCGHNTGHQLTVCQRCHHSYHFECLGTSSLRKSAGDRLWICSSCLRCKSCNSSDVTKFVGNLPFCKICFKLRQKGNFCPLCQGCYTDDDYSSKMMECADCKQWVHAKCEGLSDEKYQVLSYLPESVEFICRLCCSFPPAPWWVAVESEIQAGYSNIIKAITKNRRAYAMLKWSPQKTCDCPQQSPFTVPRSVVVPNIGKRRLSFNMQSNAECNVGLSSVSQSDQKQILGDFMLTKECPSVFEFDDVIDAGENTPIARFTHAKEKGKSASEGNKIAVCSSDPLQKPGQSVQYSPNAGSQSDSGVGSTDDELKTSSAAEEEDIEESNAIGRPLHVCQCNSQSSKHPFASLLTIKKKVHSSEYPSILDFHRDMDQLINEAESQEVKELYHQTLQEVFPWFDPKYHRINRNSFPMSPCKPHQGSLLQYQSNISSPEKPSQNSSSLQILDRLLPKHATSGLEDEYFYYDTKLDDERLCGFCKLVGDGEANAEGRLLYCGQNEWVHVNCALWSAEVFEEIDGALQNVSNALSRGRMIRCSFCDKKGASVGCCAKKCEETLHFPCARLAGFVFMEDKNVFCPLHRKDAPGKPLARPSDFDVSRPVFVELDRRKKKCIESKYVKIMIGSLSVQNLGTVIPDVSDQASCIVPTEFCCTRLFWSSKEPWRVVRYTIRTTIRIPASLEPVSDLVEHITVDHSKESYTSDPKLSSMRNVEANCGTTSDKLSKISSFPSRNKETNCIGNTTVDMSTDLRVVQSVMVHILDAVSSKETDEEVSDPQTSADLLPPELKDAIFEDLPHDLLDGISMQDIFQDKFLNFEDLGKDEVQDETNGSKCDIDKTRLKSLKACRELKRSKSDVLPSNSSQVDSRLNQRSCSLAWSYKLGTSLRLSVKPAPSVDLHYCIAGPGDKGKENKSLTNLPIMQVDGTHDIVLSGSEDSDSELGNMTQGLEQKRNGCRTPMNFTSNFAEDSALLCNRIECLKSIASATLSQNVTVNNVSEGFPNEDLRKYKRRKTKKSSCEKISLIPQLDGVNDISSDSEQEGASNKPSPSEEKPVRCSRCGCTYRTEESYTRHLPSCSGDFSLTTSESEAEITDDETTAGLKATSAPSPDSAISVSSGSQPVAPSISPTVLPAASTPCVLPDSPVVQQNVQSTSHGISSSAAKPVMPSVSNLVKSGNKVQRTPNMKSKATKTSFQQQTTAKILMRGNQSVLHQQIYEHNSHQQVRHQAIQPALPTSMPHQASQIITMLDYQHSQPSGPTVLVQSVPSQSMVPAYLEAFQQHTGQNLQYLTTVDNGASFGKTQYLTAIPSAVLPGAFQLQAIPDGQLCLEPSPVGIPTLSGIQLAPTQLAPTSISQTQPQVLGTLLPNSISCNVVATDPIYETIQMFPDQSGGVLLASQPVLTCMETVVSNTYMSMSSSQFVSSVPGMLQGSSTYSTTTTQVYQSNKVDPPILDVPTQYLVVNTHPSLPDTAVRKLEVMSISQSQIQDQAAIQTQAQIQLPSINLPVPVTAPLPPQTLPSVIPTSVVTPMPRSQPQRTYSKPSKNAKDTVAAASVSAVKRPIPQMTCSSIKEAMKLISNQSSLNCTQELLSTTDNHNISSTSVESNIVLQESVPKNFSGAQLSNPVTTFGPTSVQASSLTTNVAQARSVTLPDPVKSNLPVPSSSKVIAVTATSGPMKCPPVTFSYRAHAVEKSKLRQNLSLDLSGSTNKKDNTFQVQTSKPNNAKPILSHQQIAASVPGLNPPRKIVCSGEKQNQEGLSDMPSVSKKPIAAIPPLSQITVASKPKKVVIDETLSQVTSISLATSVSSSKATTNLKPVPTRVPLLSTCSSSVTSQPSRCIPSLPSQNQVGKNASLSLMTASITNAVTSTASSATVTMNSLKPVTSIKLQGPNAIGLKPLKEINQMNINTEAKSLQQKIQEKVNTDVPPTVLKSSCLNVNDTQKKTEMFQSQAEIPAVFQNGDNSSIKLLFQKQSHNGCYKVSSSPGKKDGELMAVKLADISIICSGSKDKKGAKDESENVKPVERISKKNPSGPEIVYEIHCQDGFSYSSNSISDAWQKVFGAVQEARATHKMPPLIHNPFSSIESGHNVMGLGNNSVKYILEQLPGVGDCSKYRPVYHKSRLPGSGYQPNKREDHELSKESQSGCARTEPFLSAKKYDMFSWLDSRHRRPPKLLENTDIEYSLTGSRRTASTSLPMAMRFRHLRETSKTSVGVFRSDIHGRGLFCLRDIEAGEMVIEYAGEVIRNTLTDNREKYYQSKGIGCYMFKVDDNFTVDATLKGNAARFINHSCEPNCYSRIVDILGKKHIIIFAFRRIPQGEELTYDYKFPIEDEKIHCHCLARRCRKYLN